MMDPRIILQLLVERLEPEVGHISLADFSAWGDDAEAKIMAGLSRGRGHLASALRHAKEALESGDPKKIRLAADLCHGFERTGREIEKKDKEAAQRKIAQTRRQAGGNKTGKKQSQEAEDIWRPWIADFEKLLAERKRPDIARRAVKTKMTKEGYVDPRTGEFPTDAVLRKWLSPKKVATQL